MSKIKLLLLTALFSLSYAGQAQCTLAGTRAATNINTLPYALDTRFNTTATSPVDINNLGSGILNFRASVAGTATWTVVAAGGIQLKNDPSVGTYIFVQPNNTDNISTTNVATYTLKFTEPVYNLSFISGGLNYLDQVKIQASLGVVPITITTANFSDFQPDPGHTGVLTASGNIVVSTNTAGGVGVITNRFTTTIAGPVDSVTITTGKADDGNGAVTLGFTSIAYARCVTVPPDLNATFVNVAVAGNVSTNDAKPAGTTYGTATALPGYTNPGAAFPTINADGTYSFTSAVTGVFKFLVPMCPPSVIAADCPLVLLVITVKDVNSITTKPTANTDRATTPFNTAVTLNTLSNDASGKQNTTLNPASVLVSTSPKYGTTSVNPANGNITYTPNAGFTGMDTLTYTVCDNSTPTALCETALQIITVKAAGSANTTSAADDYKSTLLNTAITGFNVLTNDNDPEGNTQTVTMQNTTVTGKGNLVLNTNGTYTFTPTPGFTGPVNFPYNLCDNGSPVACTMATLYILVEPLSTLPVTLVTFTAVKDKVNTQVSWVTKNQANFSRFEIEYSTSAAGNFINAGTVNANGTGSYAFTDVSAAAKGAIVFYRLKMIDLDGNFAYSNIVSVKFENTARPRLITAIVARGEDVAVVLPADNNNLYELGLFNSNGQLIAQSKSKANNTLRFPTGNLSSGLYFIAAKNSAAVNIMKFIIQ